jgi:hypothetical protein
VISPLIYRCCYLHFTYHNNNCARLILHTNSTHQAITSLIFTPMWLVAGAKPAKHTTRVGTIRR